MSRSPYASLFSPLVLFGWFLWPDPLAFTFTGVCRALFSAYALFYSSLALAGLLLSGIGRNGPRDTLAAVFVVATVISLAIGLSWHADAPLAGALTQELADALLDAVWCTVSVALLMQLRKLPLRR